MDDQGAFLTIGGGLVTVVVLATTFSSLMESRSVKVDAQATTRVNIEEDLATVSTLKEELAEARLRWIERVGRKSKNGVGDARRRAVIEGQKRLERLHARKVELSSEIANAEAAFVRYQSSYRASTWSSAVGEAVGTLTTRDGREYHNAQISRVTEEGIEIRHDDGIAKIGSDQLGENWHHRFQWKWQVEMPSSR